ncbi:hypothetical protein N9Y61_05535, partial [Paracoccaceae bacterium]|nr:hypothetical protein [Paracoccaceae bacterium]
KAFTNDELETLAAMIPQYVEPELIRVRIKERDEFGVTRKRSVAVSNTSETIRMRKNIQLINKALSKYWYDLEISNEELNSLQFRLADEVQNQRTIRMDHRSLYRVFNSVDLETGGRFYGGWWQNIPREYRQHLIVNGKRMVELDYSNQHPTILYAKLGYTPPADCYAGVIDQLPLQNVVARTEVRDMVKASFNAMLNSTKPLKQAPTGINPGKFGMKWSDITNAIMGFHEPIAHNFYTGVGLRLQRLDSDIAEKILLHFATQGIAILPLHDSFLMHEGYESWLEPVMIAAFEKVVGISPKITKKLSNLITIKDGLGDRRTLDAPTTKNLLNIINSMPGHEKRLHTFLGLSSKSEKSDEFVYQSF